MKICKRGHSYNRNKRQCPICKKAGTERWRTRMRAEGIKFIGGYTVFPNTVNGASRLRITDAQLDLESQEWLKNHG